MTTQKNSKNATQNTVAFLRDVLRNATLEGRRGKLDMFSDRLTKSASEPTLAKAMEHLMQAVQVEMDKMYQPLVIEIMRISAAPEGPRVLRWLREQTKLIAMLAAGYNEKLTEEILTDIPLPEPYDSSHAMPARRDFFARIEARCEAPLAHGADGKLGNSTMFRRIKVMTPSDTVMDLPYYSGNAVRGQMRDLLADHFLRSLGLTANRQKPAVALWFFYALYSGGALEEKSDATKAVTRMLGNHGATRADGIRQFRDWVPPLSLLGCALGNRVLPGHVQFSDLRPRCREWGNGSRPIDELMAWEFLTRREDLEEHDKNSSMIANTEVLRTGAELEGGVDIDSSVPDIERHVLATGLRLLTERGLLGAENRRGLGRVTITIDSELGDGKPYEDWLASNKELILEYLDEIGALAKEPKSKEKK